MLTTFGISTTIGYRLQQEEERNGIDMEQSTIAERLEAATTLMERTLSWLEERQQAFSSDVERITQQWSKAAAKRSSR